MDKKRRKKSIKNNIAIGVSLVLLISNAFMILINNYFLEQYFGNQVKDDMITITNQVSNTIQAELDKTESQVTELANNLILIEGKEKDKVNFYQKRASELGFKLFFYIKPDGTGINLTPKAETFDLSDAEYFKQSMKGKTYTTNIITDKLTGEKITIVSAPYYDDGKLAGVFAGIKPADFISNLTFPAILYC